MSSAFSAIAVVFAATGPAKSSTFWMFWATSAILPSTSAMAFTQGQTIVIGRICIPVYLIGFQERN